MRLVGFSVLSLVLLLPFGLNALPFGGDYGGGLSFGGGSTTFNIEGDVLLHVYKSFYARTGVLGLSFASGGTIFTLGTGSTIDVMYFFNPQNRWTPYGFGGMNIVSGGGMTTTSFRFGVGADHPAPRKGMLFFGQFSLDIASVSVEGASSSNTTFTIMGGVRIR